MKKRLQGFIAGVLCCSIFAGIGVYAKEATQTIEAIYRNIKIYADGVNIDPKDANGSTVEPLIYNGTTYLPVRAIGNALGMQVDWNGATTTVNLHKDTIASETYMVEVCPAYEIGGAVTDYKQSEGKTFKMSGMTYSNGMTFGGADRWALFVLNGKYSNMTFE